MSHLDSRQGEALAAYQRARRVLVRDLGVEPGAQLRRLHQQSLASDPALLVRAATAGMSAAGESIGNGNRKLAGRPAGRGSEVVPRQLPAGMPHFTGRAAELAMLSRLLEEPASGPGAVVISAIGRMAGVGKTALAVHWAHQVAEQFPDGQLYANLHGFDPSAESVEPTAAVREFLGALGFPAERIPASPEAQAALYRSLLAGKQMLLVLDNARDEDQVRPLLPGIPDCLVVVTSRTQLTGLAVAEGACLVNGVHALALDAARQTGDRAAEADALRSRCATDYWQGRYDQTASQLRQALAIYRDLGNQYGLARTLNNLGLVLRRQGRIRQAIDHHQQSFDLSRDIGDTLGQALTLDNLGIAFCQQGRYQQAADYHRRALILNREIGSPRGESATLGNLGTVLCKQGCFQEAAGWGSRSARSRSSGKRTSPSRRACSWPASGSPPRSRPGRSRPGSTSAWTSSSPGRRSTTRPTHG